MQKTKKEYWDAWYAKNKDRERDRQLRNKFGISLEQYKQIAEKQNHKCAICSKNQSESKKSLQVDHDHSTGTIRGLLCWSCNFAIGLFRENPESMAKAIDYLKTNMPGNSL